MILFLVITAIPARMLANRLRIFESHDEKFDLIRSYVDRTLVAMWGRACKGNKSDWIIENKKLLELVVNRDNLAMVLGAPKCTHLLPIAYCLSLMPIVQCTWFVA